MLARRILGLALLVLPLGACSATSSDAPASNHDATPDDTIDRDVSLDAEVGIDATHDTHDASDTTGDSTTADVPVLADSADTAPAADSFVEASIDADATADACTVGCDGELIGTETRGRWIAVDDTNVYVAKWVGSGIEWAPKTGGAFHAIATPVSEDVHALLADGDSLYFTTSGTSSVHLYRVPKIGGAPVALFSASPASNIDIENLVVDATSIYVSSSTGAGGTPSVRRIDKTSGAVTTLFSGSGRYLAQDGANLFWISGGKLWMAPKTFVVAPVSIDTVFSSAVTELVADAADVFYGASEDAIELHRVSSTAPYLDTKLHTAVAITPATGIGPTLVDATYVYDVDTGDLGTVGGAPGAIYRVARAGGSLMVFAAEPQPTGIAADATYLYWTNYGNEVRRKAK